MAWNRHAVAQTQLRKHVASTAWDAGPKFDFHTGGELLVVDGNTKSIISHGLGHGVLHYLSVTQGGLSRSEPLITRETPWYVAAGLLLSSFGLFFDLLERTEFPPWLKTTQAVASALLVPTTVPLIMARFRVLRLRVAGARGPTVSHTGLRRHRPHHIL